jgi:hypothetical protein
MRTLVLLLIIFLSFGVEVYGQSLDLPAGAGAGKDAKGITIGGLAAGTEEISGVTLAGIWLKIQEQGKMVAFQSAHSIKSKEHLMGFPLVS